MGVTNGGHGHHQILILGGGTAGISVAARLVRSGENDVAVVEPSTKHYYQPLWTLVGGGRAPAAESVREESSVMPKGVAWIRDAAVEIDPDGQVVTLGSGRTVTYDWLVVCPGIQLDWADVPGLADSVEGPRVSTNYRFDLAPKTWELIRSMRRGTALFTMPSGPIKCGGAPQKIAYLACDHWRQEGVLKDIDVILAVPTPKIFGVPDFAEPLMGAIRRYGIDLRTSTELNSIDGEAGTATLVVQSGDAEQSENITFDFAHAVPPQSAPDWIKRSPLSTGDAKGYVDVDKNTMQHVRWPNVFRAGRCRQHTQLQDGRRHSKAGTRRGGQPARGSGRSPDGGVVRRVLVVSHHDGPQQDGAGRVRLHDGGHAQHPVHQYEEGAVRHVAAEAVRAAVPVLEPDAQRPRLTSRRARRSRGARRVVVRSQPCRTSSIGGGSRASPSCGG